MKDKKSFILDDSGVLGLLLALKCAYQSEILAFETNVFKS